MYKFEGGGSSKKIQASRKKSSLWEFRPRKKLNPPQKLKKLSRLQFFSSRHLPSNLYMNALSINKAFLLQTELVLNTSTLKGVAATFAMICF